MFDDPTLQPIPEVFKPHLELARKRFTLFTCLRAIELNEKRLVPLDPFSACRR
jgi:hypothetical protein